MAVIDLPPPVLPAEPPTAALDVADVVDRPRWYRPALSALLVGTFLAYVWDLGASGWANAFYSAAAQAGGSDWKAFFFGSLDGANAITVDKPPAALWVMGLSVRLFGLSSWSILVPEALMGVGTVALVVATVRRWFRPGAALLAGAVVATTPVVALIFRFNNPDALLVLVLTASAYAMTRAHEDGSTRWLVLAGSLVGVGFLTKMLQAFLVLPGFGLAWLLLAPGNWRRRLWQSVVLGVSTLAALSWWVAIVELWPAASRPYIGGSQHNSVLELVFGYNGFGRLTGNETGSVGGGGPAGAGGPGGGMWGPTGWLRMFNDSFGGQASWLLPAALVLLAGGLAWTARRPRTDRARYALVLWGAWLIVTALTFSLGQGIIHEYYTVALAPAIGALVGIGGSVLWDARATWPARAVLAVALALTTWWAVVLLERTPSWLPWLRPAVVVVGLAGVVLLAVGAHRRRVAVAAVVAAAVAGLAGPSAYALDTVTTPHQGSLPLAGPATRSGPGGRPGGGPFPGGQLPGGGQGGNRLGPPTGAFPAAAGVGGPGVGGPGVGGPGGGGPGGGGPGGLLEASTVTAEVKATLLADADAYTWVAAAVGSQQASGYQLATERPVMALGGFNGTDPSPTLAEFQALVARHAIHYVIGSGGFGGAMGGSRESSEIATWVASTFTSTTVGGVTLYDLTAPLTR